MILSEVKDILEAKIIVGDASQKAIDRACACDLLSEVLRCIRARAAANDVRRLVLEELDQK